VRRWADCAVPSKPTSHPPQRFLTWLLNNPHSLVWPVSSKGEPVKFGQSTQSLRERLISGDEIARSEALRSIHNGVSARRAWWAFEGWTSVDCWLETDQLVVFIEGKRTEPISAATSWFPVRNQVVVCLDCTCCRATKPRFTRRSSPRLVNFQI
jgi:hypothetical protein